MYSSRWHSVPAAPECNIRAVISLQPWGFRGFRGFRGSSASDRLPAFQRFNTRRARKQWKHLRNTLQHLKLWAFRSNHSELTQPRQKHRHEEPHEQLHATCWASSNQKWRNLVHQDLSKHIKTIRKLLDPNADDWFIWLRKLFIHINLKCKMNLLKLEPANISRLRLLLANFTDTS